MIINGAGNRIIGDKVEKYVDTDFVLLGSNLSHYWDNADINKQTHPKTAGTFIQFEDNLFDHLLDKEAFHPIKIMLQYASRGIEFHGQTRIAAMERMQQLTQLKDFEAWLHFLDLLNFLAHSEEKKLIASAGYSTKIVMKESKRIDEVYEYMLQNFQKQITVKEVADIANMSESAFSHFFKKSTNRSYMKFLTEIRLSHACQLLNNTQLNVKEIAYNCGYVNLSNFNRLFKKYRKTSPLEYRKKSAYTIPVYEDRFIKE